MISSNLLRLAPVLAVAASSAMAAPFLRFEDNSEIFLTGAVQVSADDNIYFSHDNKKSSGILDVLPGLEWVFGNNAAYKGTLSISDNYRTYFDASGQDVNLVTAALVSQYTNDRSTVNLNAGWRQVAQNTRDVQSNDKIIRRDITTVNPSAEVAISPKTRLGAGFEYANTEYKNSTLSDQTTYAVPVDGFYEVTSKVFGSVGYRYRDNQLQNSANDSQDHFFNVGARGDFSPKLTGTVKVGYNIRDRKTGSTESGFGMKADLTYELTPKSNLMLLASNDFDNASSGEDQKVFNAGVAWNTKLSEVLVLNITGSYGHYKYLVTPREDDYFEGKVGLTYAVNTLLNVFASYTYRNNDSSFTTATFTGNIFAVGASVRY